MRRYEFKEVFFVSQDFQCLAKLKASSYFFCLMILVGKTNFFCLAGVDKRSISRALKTFRAIFSVSHDFGWKNNFLLTRFLRLSRIVSSIVSKCLKMAHNVSDWLNFSRGCSLGRGLR